MRNAIARATAPVIAIAVASILSACGRDARDRAAKAPASADSAAGEVRTTAGATVVFHMTGLLLLVPYGKSMHVLMPAHAGHTVRLGFGMDETKARHPDLCSDEGFSEPYPSEAGVCYVDLEHWTLADFGAGGQPEDPLTHPVPPGVLDITQYWQYQVRIPPSPGFARARMTMLSGQPAGPCSLARWKFKPYARPGGPHPVQTAELVNVMKWVVTGLTNPQLVFRHKKSGARVIVPLPGSGISEVVLAHIPESQLDELPPQGGGSPSGARDVARDFDGYYRLAQRSSALPVGHPRTPYGGEELSTTCSVAITRPARDRAQRSPRTFSCMMATAERL
jgi:hypothetical protein